MIKAGERRFRFRFGKDVRRHGGQRYLFLDRLYQTGLKNTGVGDNEDFFHSHFS